MRDEIDSIQLKVGKYEGNNSWFNMTVMLKKRLLVLFIVDERLDEYKRSSPLLFMMRK